MKLFVWLRGLAQLLVAQLVSLALSLWRPSLFRRVWIIMVVGVLFLFTMTGFYIKYASPSFDAETSKVLSLEANAIARLIGKETDINAITRIADDVKSLSLEFTLAAPSTRPRIKDVHYAIFDVRGVLLAASNGAPLAEMQQRADSSVGQLPVQLIGTANLSPTSQWVLTNANDSQGRIVVYGLATAIYRGVNFEVMMQELPNLFWQLCIISLFIWMLTRFAFRPIDGLAREINKLDVTHFEILQPQTQYRELVGVVAAINDRTQVAQQSVAREREFFSNAAHELRTPLAVVSAQAHSLAQSDDPAVRKVESERLQAGVARAASLVSRLLNLARLDGHAAATSYVDLGAVATECCSTHALRAIRAEQELALEQDETNNAGTGKCEAVAAAEDVQLIIENLVDNAIRYAGAGAVIVVRTGYVEQYQVDGNGTNNRWAMVSVSNTGAGFTELDKARAFTRFQRGSRADQSSGSGLGLAIVKAAAERHGGHVRLIAPADGVGACVEVRLPPKPKNA
jgi:two-component system, OmpR family, sensor histidine kinase QseC